MTFFSFQFSVFSFQFSFFSFQFSVFSFQFSVFILHFTFFNLWEFYDNNTVHNTSQSRRFDGSFE
ncbi:MAG: hypothetical protein DRR08_03660 [Candidatus Parabeggiatoa sp. nov. 2]|nr:MAG: hypothetical protein DRR08_03660 [Gammaproteobacteria bacterium]